MIKKVMISSPLFNPKEIEENYEIAEFLEEKGFETYLPQRDGFLLRTLIKGLLAGEGKKRIDTVQAIESANKSIFCIDGYNACKRCQALVLNLNGRVPDEGACFEGGMSFASGKIVIPYKTDSRTLIRGQDNPMIKGLGKIASTYEEIYEGLKNAERKYEDMVKHGKALSRRKGDLSRMIKYIAENLIE